MSNLKHKERVKERAQARTLRKEIESLSEQFVSIRTIIADFNKNASDLRNSNLYNMLQDIMGELRQTKYAIWLAFPAVKNKQLAHSLPEIEPTNPENHGKTPL